MKYYISDTHFGHDNIRRLSNRPFSSSDEMDEVMINNWNSRVSNNDEVYILGDLRYGKNENDVEYYLSRLNGIKYFILGNHDKEISNNKRKYREYFNQISDIMTVQDGKDKIVLCHYPLVEWEGYFRGVLHFYGHVHNNVQNDTYKMLAKIPNAYNVGVDVLDFTPRTKDEVIKYNQKFLKANGLT